MRDVRLEQADRVDWALDGSGSWGEPSALVSHLRDNTNHVTAALLIDWSELCPEGARILDLGCGSGWLTAILTREPRVGRVIAWDSSRRSVGEFLPVAMKIMDGDWAKAEPVCGDFVPLLLEDESLDLVVMASAFHHCDRPDELLGEIRRVLAPGGALLLLNETPWHRLAMLSFAVRTVAAALANLVGRRLLVRRAGHLAADHVLYDPLLGDRAMTLPQWHDLAARCGWSLERIETGLPPYRSEFRGRGRLEPDLTHFLLRPRTS
jgi:ubiquinone/menaquinone biosynthesis C-methylase UbiE